MHPASDDDPPVRLLGPVALHVDGASLAGTKQRLLFAVLVLHAGRVVSTDRLAEVLWPNDAPGDPRRALQVHVSKLRTVLDRASLPAVIEHEDAGYVLHLDPGLTDLGRFEQLVEEGTALVESQPSRAASLLREAALLWRGPPLGHLADESAIRPEIARIEELRWRATHARIEAGLRTGAHDRVVPELEGLVEEQPLREPWWGQLMRAHYLAGRQGDALATYARARHVLREQLGIDPSRALRELHQRILTQDPDLDASGEGRGAGDGPAGGDRTRLAILPFDVIGDGEGAAFLALGLHNDLCAEVARSPALIVISRNSVREYDGATVAVPTVARELGVGTVVTGMLQSAGVRFRLTVQLVDGATAVPVWTGTYDAELTAENLFTVQTDLAREIADALSTELTPGEAGDDRQHRPPTSSLDAYRLVAEGRHHADLRTEDGLRRAVDGFEQAVAVDPGYVEAWTEMVHALVAMEAYGHGDRHRLLSRAERALHRAMALDGDAPAVRTSLGVMHIAYQDGPAAIAEFDHAIRLRPNSAVAHNWHTWASLLTGDVELAFRLAERACELDPRAAEVHAHLALVCAASGQSDRALAAARLARRLSPYTTADLYEAICLCELGRYREARLILEPLLSGADGDLAVPWAGQAPDALAVLASTRLGDAGSARRVAATIDDLRFPFAAGLARLALGEIDHAARLLSRSGRLSAWPCLAVHHYHAELWSSVVGTEMHAELVRRAYRSWNVAVS